MVDTGLKDKVVVVTGGNNPKGIGAATASAFAAQGAKVFIHYFRAKHELVKDLSDIRESGEDWYNAAQTMAADHVIDAIRAGGGRAEACEADLAEPSMASTLFDRAEKTFGPVQVLVNNAAYCAPDTFLPSHAGDRTIGGLGPLMRAITAASHDQHFAVNSRAVALLMKEFARRHIARGAHLGWIINVSTDGAAGFPNDISEQARWITGQLLYIGGRNRMPL